jgi:hypothetical protein
VVEEWNGSSWSIVASPSSAVLTESALSSVSCVSTLWCEAVGSDNAGTLAEQWNGGSWSVVAAPNPVDASSPQLDGVSCVSMSWCVAVGSDPRAFILRYNGISWSIATSPNVGPDAVLQGVSCSNPSACLAVGTSGVADGSTMTLSERWNGTNWSKLSTSNPDPNNN